MMSLRRIPQCSLLFLLMVLGVVSQEWGVNYPQKSICALKGSTAVMRCSYTYPPGYRVHKAFWSRQLDTDEKHSDLLLGQKYRGRAQYNGEKLDICTLRLSNVTEQDQGKYYFRFVTTPGGSNEGQDGVELFLREVQVEMIPDSVVEGDDITLTCKTTCSLTNTPSFIWYKTGSPLSYISSSNPLLLPSVSQNDSGDYICALRGQGAVSHAVTLDVQMHTGGRSVVLYVVLGVTVGCGCLFAIIGVLCMRRKRKEGSADDAMFHQNVHSSVPDDTYTALDLQTRSSNEVYHTLAMVDLSPPDDTYTSLDPHFISPDYDTLTAAGKPQ